MPLETFALWMLQQLPQHLLEALHLLRQLLQLVDDWAQLPLTHWLAQNAGVLLVQPPTLHPAVVLS